MKPPIYTKNRLRYSVTKAGNTIFYWHFPPYECAGIGETCAQCKRPVRGRKHGHYSHLGGGLICEPCALKLLVIAELST